MLMEKLEIKKQNKAHFSYFSFKTKWHISGEYISDT